MATVVEGFSSPEVLDTDELLAPLAGANPSGARARDLTEYDELAREVRASRVAGVTLPGENSQDRRPANWGRVEEMSVELLRSKSKDLEVCAWMAEALTHNHGFAGARDGLKVMVGLHERLWETVHPEIDLGDAEREEGEPLPADALVARINVLEAMDKWLAAALRGVPLTRSVFGNYSYEKFEYSKKFVIPEDLESVDEQERRYIETLKSEGKITAEQWQKAKDLTPTDFYRLSSALAAECAEEFAALKRVVGERYDNPPGFPQLERALDEVGALVRIVLKEKDPTAGLPAATAAAAAPTDDAAAAAAEPTSGAPAHTRSRQEALRKLGEVAEFFRRTEPHSPVSYLVERAVKWGHMPLETWLREVVKNEDVLAQVRETLGLGQAPPPADGGDKSLDET